MPTRIEVETELREMKVAQLKATSNLTMWVIMWSGLIAVLAIDVLAGFLVSELRLSQPLFWVFLVVIYLAYLGYFILVRKLLNRILTQAIEAYTNPK
jgi:hypothetical protein